MFFLSGLLAALAMIFLLLKLNLKRIAKYDIILDIILTFFFIWIFAGTFAGMMAGLWAGAIISIFLWVVKRSVPREELRILKVRKFPYRKIAWVPVETAKR
jgi:MFS superfamily sulfate permease-like transporter